RSAMLRTEKAPGAGVGAGMRCFHLIQRSIAIVRRFPVELWRPSAVISWALSIFGRRRRRRPESREVFHKSHDLMLLLGGDRPHALLLKGAEFSFKIAK